MGAVAVSLDLGALNLFVRVVTTQCLPSDGRVATQVRQIGGFRSMERWSHLNIQDPSWQKYVWIIPT